MRKKEGKKETNMMQIGLAEIMQWLVYRLWLVVPREGEHTRPSASEIIVTVTANHNTVITITIILILILTITVTTVVTDTAIHIFPNIFVFNFIFLSSSSGMVSVNRAG